MPLSKWKKIQTLLPRQGQRRNISALDQRGRAKRAAFQGPLSFAPSDWNDDGFDQATNAIPDLLRAGKLDEAEAAAHALLVDFPDMIDGFDRLGMVYEKRGNHQLAADYYRKAMHYIDEFPHGFEDASKEHYKDRIASLDPQPD